MPPLTTIRRNRIMATNKETVSAEYIHQFLINESGILRWKLRTIEMFPGDKAVKRCKRWNSCYSNKIAGWRGVNGYWYICINRVFYMIHRIVWLLESGSWPKNEIDHINGIENGDGIDNLREATRSENMQNYKFSRANTSGYTGVSWSSAASKWKVQIKHNGNVIYLGLFDSRECAHQRYLIAKEIYHKLQPTLCHR